MRKCLAYFLIICILFCSCQSYQTPLLIEKKISINNRNNSRDKWMALAFFVRGHFDTGDKTLEVIAADLSLAAYYAGIE